MSDPLVVIVSGAPGSGKTTLAGAIAQYMMLPHVERDKIVRGLECTSGVRVDRAVVGIPVYFRQLDSMLNDGISFVTDGTLYRGVSEKDIQEHIISRAKVVNVHARASNSRERFYEREMNRTGWPNDWVEDHMRHLDKIHPQTVDPLELGVPVIEVDASGDYDPTVKDIAKIIRQYYSNPKGE